VLELAQRDRGGGSGAHPEVVEEFKDDVAIPAVLRDSRLLARLEGCTRGRPTSCAISSNLR